MNMPSLAGVTSSFLATLAIVLVLAASLLYFWQHRMIYYPRDYGSVDLDPAIIQQISYVTGQGQQVSFFIAAKNNNQDNLPDKLWLVMGGNASVALDWYSFVASYPGDSSAFLLIDYPGYGYSEGSASPAAIIESCITALDSLATHLSTEKKNLAERVSFIGHSLGAGVALRLANEITPQSLVLIAPFTSMRDMATRMVGWPLNNLLRHNFDNRANLSELLDSGGAPHVTILHGDQDEIIPVHMGRQLAATFRQVEYLEVKGGDHNGILSEARGEIYMAMQGRQ